MRKGECYIFLEAFLWSLFPVITIVSYGKLSPLFTAGISTFISSIFFALMLFLRGRWRELWVREAWGDILATSFILGAVFYGLLFTALRSTTAGNAAIIGQMEVFFSFFILGIILKHEHFHLPHFLGGIFMVLGAALVLYPNATGWRTGDLLVLLTTIIAPFGNYYMQRARKRVNAETILFVRSLVGGCFLFLLAFVLEPLPSMNAVLSSWILLFVNGFVLLGFTKILWIEATILLSITKAISLSSVGPFFTLVLAYFILQERVTVLQVMGLLPIVLGVMLLTRRVRTYVA